MPYQDILSRHEDLKKTKYHHKMLVMAPDFDAAEKKVLHFFEKYELVRYSFIEIKGNESMPASDQQCEQRIREAILENRQILNGLVQELQDEQVRTLDDLKDLPQGYKSKMLHVITHFVDGFFGIDTYFYNLTEYSHWVTQPFWDKIRATPADYWLLSVEAEV
jgi:hypothetical protein